MSKKWEEYIRMKIDGKSNDEIISIARNDYSIATNPNYKEDYDGTDIPFNLEKIYFDELIDKKNYTEAETVLKRMQLSYFDREYQNFLESYEHHLRAIRQSEKIITDSILDAKKEFNRHTITLVSVIVGIITIFGSASAVFRINSYKEMVLSFLLIVFSVIAVILVATLANTKYTRKK